MFFIVIFNENLLYMLRFSEHDVTSHLISNGLWKFRSFSPFAFLWNFWMFKYNGEFRNFTMSETLKILQIGIP